MMQATISLEHAIEELEFPGVYLIKSFFLQQPKKIGGTIHLSAENLHPESSVYEELQHYTVGIVIRENSYCPGDCVFFEYDPKNFPIIRRYNEDGVLRVYRGWSAFAKMTEGRKIVEIKPMQGRRFFPEEIADIYDFLSKCPRTVRYLNNEYKFALLGRNLSFHSRNCQEFAQDLLEDLKQVCYC
jgi:hypothetical protein